MTELQGNSAFFSTFSSQKSPEKHRGLFPFTCFYHSLFRLLRTRNDSNNVKVWLLPTFNSFAGLGESSFTLFPFTLLACSRVSLINQIHFLPPYDRAMHCNYRSSSLESFRVSPPSLRMSKNRRAIAQLSLLEQLKEEGTASRKNSSWC